MLKRLNCIAIEAAAKLVSEAEDILIEPSGDDVKKALDLMRQAKSLLDTVSEPASLPA